MVPTYLAVPLPAGTYGRISPRTRFATKETLVLGCVVDCYFTGNVAGILGNIHTATLSVQSGHRIARLFCECIAVPVPTEVPECGTIIRGNSGFGSTGITAVQVFCHGWPFCGHVLCHRWHHCFYIAPSKLVLVVQGLTVATKVITQTQGVPVLPHYHPVLCLYPLNQGGL